MQLLRADTRRPPPRPKECCECPSARLPRDPSKCEQPFRTPLVGHSVLSEDRSAVRRRAANMVLRRQAASRSNGAEFRFSGAVVEGVLSVPFAPEPLAFGNLTSRKLERVGELRRAAQLAYCFGE